MEQLKEYIPIILISIPTLLTILFYLLHFHFVQKKWKAVHFSVQYSAVFYIIADILLLEILFSTYFIGFALIMLISMLAMILIVQWKQNTEVILKNGLTILWRISFLIFSLGYCVLVIYQLVSIYQ